MLRTQRNTNGLLVAIRRLAALGPLAIVLSIAIAACAPAAAPTPTSVPVKPTAVPAPVKPAETPAAPTAKPAASSAGAPSAKAPSSSEWEKTVAAAKQEGKVIVAGGPGEQYRKGVMAFQKAYPEIQVEYSGVQGASFAPKIIAERKGGQYLWDAYFGGPETAVIMLMPNGILDPIRPALMLPEVLDDSKWFGGFEDSWVDKGRQYVFAYSGYLNYTAWINRSLVPQSELNSMDQLLDAKWKGKIVTPDPRTTGPFGTSTAYLLMLKGEDWLRKLYSQDLVITPDPRQLMEAVIRGRYPIAMGATTTILDQFKREGLLTDVKPLSPDTTDGSLLVIGFGGLGLVNKAPHPNAAKVFVNWLLSKEGQTAYVEATGQNSRRLDVAGAPDYAPKAGVKYQAVQKEESMHYQDKAMSLAKEMIK